MRTIAAMRWVSDPGVLPANFADRLARGQDSRAVPAEGSQELEHVRAVIHREDPIHLDVQPFRPLGDSVSWRHGF